jgi:hypothetical protein
LDNEVSSTFSKLNTDWNAEPNAPNPQVQLWEHDVVLSFLLNPFLYPQFKEEDVGQLRFRNCWRYRLGSVNDEGWYRGQCRFSKLAPAWGEFYMVSGDLLLEQCADDWVQVGHMTDTQKHFLFYFRDEEYECDAESWSFTVLR